MRNSVLHVAALLACLGAAVSVAVAQDPPPPIKIGLVDLDLVGRSFERKLKEERILGEWLQQQQLFLDELGQYVFCAATEWEEVIELLQTPRAARNEAQRKRLTELVDVSTGREREYGDLRGKLERTPEEEERYKLLLDIGRTRDTSLKQMIDAAELEIRQRKARIAQDMMVPVKAVINGLAAERGLTYVLERQWVYFGGEDITDEVIKRLNAGEQPPEEAEKPTEGEGEGGATEEPKEEGDGEKPAEGEGEGDGN